MSPPEIHLSQAFEIINPFRNDEPVEEERQKDVEEQSGVVAITVLDDDNESLRILSGYTDGTALIWELPGAGTSRLLADFRRTIGAATMSKLAGSLLFIAGDLSGMVRVADVTNGSVWAPFDGHDNAIRAIATGEFEGRPVVASGDEVGLLRVWDLVARESICAIDLESPILTVTMPSSGVIAVSTWRGLQVLQLGSDRRYLS
jgi:WD40 repeat protein